ncbi:hypothetical protein N7468_009081 [Penicillium chermesinum]|uniref:CENP-T/Histone H4 histone fold domain-containing protein n=1 Tax=Penicillium chermesinum TaxID=63820 RepID=A0A9W9NHA9_9EURO|nr:uncharacterized protein N7468_009081 [Penicillium chermesinum]KAJ5219877.1 hypothetical protein N7468_009081 [Penicillium chermesinum]
MSTPRTRRESGTRLNTPSGEPTLTGLQRLPSHTLYPLTPSRLITDATPSRQRSASRFTPRFTPRARGAGAPATPYGLRARQQRAANTPARERRKSGRAQRETTFDILRNLGRALAPVSKPIQSSPQEEPQPVEESVDEIDELDNEPEIERPRLSLPFQGADDASDETSPKSPPRLSLQFNEEDLTVEYPRRALPDRDRERLSMLSPGVGRISDFGGTQIQSDSDGGDETGVISERAADETLISGGDFDRGGETEDLGRFNFDFNFPSPVAATFDDPMDDEQFGETEGFELSAGNLEPAPRSPSSDDDDAGGDFGFGLRTSRSAVCQSEPGEKKLSRYGIPVPNLPAGVVKKMATRFARTGAGSKAKLNKAAMAAIEQASSWFFEQASNDLAAYSKHAGRKTIDESDVTTLMRRQRQTNNTVTVFSLAQKYLPKELQQDMRLAMPP